jgi:hypothetical protein
MYASPGARRLGAGRRPDGVHRASLKSIFLRSFTVLFRDGAAERGRTDHFDVRSMPQNVHENFLYTGLPVAGRHSAAWKRAAAGAIPPRRPTSRRQHRRGARRYARRVRRRSHTPAAPTPPPPAPVPPGLRLGGQRLSQTGAWLPSRGTRRPGTSSRDSKLTVPATPRDRFQPRAIASSSASATFCVSG